MNGYQISFYTTLNRRVQGKPVKNWLIDTARDIGIAGATVFAGIEGYGHDRRFHSAHFFELADEPILVVMVVSDTERAALMQKLMDESLDLFHVIQNVEFGSAGV